MIEDDLKDTRDIYICVYDEDKIGVFKKISWHTRPYKTYIGNKFNAGNIYIGIDTDHIGMNKTHEDTFNKDKWEPVGTYVKYGGKKYISDCEIKKAINLDTIRQYMYYNKKIQDYIPGNATSKEVVDTLIYAYEYLGIDLEEVKQNTKIY